MKKVWIFLFVAILLSGCSKEALETVSDVPVAPAAAMKQQVYVQLPKELSSPTLQSEETGALYLCDDYFVTVETVEAGDLAKTIQNTTGLRKENLQIMETKQDDVKRYQWVWTSNAETGTQIGRGCILDDGAYHYVLTAQADERAAEKVQSAWKEIFASFQLAEKGIHVNTGS